MRSHTVLAVGIAGGVTGEVLHLPAGALVGSLAAVAMLNILTDTNVAIHPHFRLPSRVVIGASIGSLATPAVLESLGASIGWVIGATVTTLTLSLLLGLGFARLTGIDARTGVLACCPGGIAEMTTIAEDNGADAELVVGVHLIRKIVVLLAVVVVAALT